MKKSLTALTAASLLLAVAGCSANDGEAVVSPSAAAVAPSAPASAADTATAAPASSPTATPVALAEGFPADRIPVMDGADILSSTVDRSGRTVTSVLVASSPAPAADILAFYDAALTGQGFEAAPAADGAPSSRDYVRAGSDEPETVNITVIVKDGGRATVTVGSTLITETDK